MTRYIGNPLTLGSVQGGDFCMSMTAAERARHLYVVGATRTGKSKLLEDCIRQDILAWPRSGCGLMLLDRHGSLNDSVMKWAAARGLDNVPIVPIDLRRSDWVVSYNPLRRRDNGEEESVVVGNFARSILHAWGQTDSNATPRLAKWLDATLFALHTNGFTLAEALQLIVSPAIRRTLTATIEDSVARSIWETAPVKEADFQEMVESTVNRVRKFLSRRVMRATLGQTEVSLDLGRAIEEGQILLVSIATEGAKIDEEDASTFGSLLLSDLWMAAKVRGKRDEGQVKPFYVYLDEFQEYVTPSMAETLDQASGFGLHMTLAHQFPSQLLKSDQGKQLYNSVLANCRSKVVFQLEHNDDVEQLALMLFRQKVDLRKVKHELYSTKVLGHQLQYLPSYSNGTSEGVGGGTQESRTVGRSYTYGSNWSHTDSESESFTESDGTSDSLSVGVGESTSYTDGTNESTSDSHGTSDGESDTEGRSWGESEGQSSGETTSDGRNWGRSKGQNHGTLTNKGTSQSRTVSFGTPDDELQEELADRDEDADKERLERKYGQSISITDGESDGEALSEGSSTSESAGGSTSLACSRGSSVSRSQGGSRAHAVSRSESQAIANSSGRSEARSRGESRSLALSHGTSHSEALTTGTSASDSYGGNESWGESSADTRGTNTSWNRGTSHSVTHSPMLMPIYGRELSSVTFETVQEQLFRFAQYLSGQPDRHCVVKLVSQPPVPIRTRTVKPALTTLEWAQEWATDVVKSLRFALPMADALAVIVERHRTIKAGLLQPVADPASTRIPIPVKALVAGQGIAVRKPLP